MSAPPIAARAAGRSKKVLSEQRSHERYPIELEVEYRLLAKGRSRQIGSGKTRNISSGGVLFESLGSCPATGSSATAVALPLGSSLDIFALLVGLSGHRFQGGCSGR